MTDSDFIEVQEKLARNEASRKKMFKSLGIIWGIGGSLVFVLIAALVTIAFFTAK